MTIHRLDLASPVWDEAHAERGEQELRISQLGAVISSRPISGLYKDEQDHGVGDFPTFAHYIRTRISKSPRTLMRQSLQLAFEQKRANSYDVEQPYQELCKALRAAGATKSEKFFTVAKAVESFPKGVCFHRYAQARHKLQELSSNNDTSLMDMRIVAGFRSKRQKLKASAPTEEEIQELLEREEQKRYLRLMQLHATVEVWKKKLSVDHQYQKHQLITKLWKQCGGDELWTNFLIVDSTICRGRGNRGQRFEDSASEHCFAMIALKLQQDSDPGQCPFTDFGYQRNVYWWKNGEKVGEIDLVVTNKHSQIVALCEMKGSCFEIAMAARQHEAKLAEATSNETTDRWAIGETVESSIHVSYEEKSRISLFIATILPEEDQYLSQLGVEPGLTNALGLGIRDQHRCIQHASNNILCQPLVEMIQDSCRLQEASDYLRHLPYQQPLGGYLTEHDASEVDYELLRAYVLSRVDETNDLIESPLRCFHRYRQDGRILVLPPRWA